MGELIRRQHRRARWALAWGAGLAFAAALAACGGGDAAVEANAAATQAAASRAQALSLRTSGTSGTAAIAQPANTEGRLLASNCFQCHGTLGLGGFDKIRGSEASEVLEFLTKPAGKDIMAAHAQGYTREQLQKIITYLQQ